MESVCWQVGDLEVAGSEVSGGRADLARCDPLWTAWFLRRNEVLIPLEGQP